MFSNAGKSADYLTLKCCLAVNRGGLNQLSRKLGFSKKKKLFLLNFEVKIMCMVETVLKLNKPTRKKVKVA